jgi:imidazolonepropionase-like amidohydrolase
VHGPYALTGVDLVLGDRAGTVLPGRYVAVAADGTVAGVGPVAEVPAGLRTIDLTGHHVLPGLINAHAHLFADGRPLAPVLTSARAERAVALFLRTPVGRALVRRRTRANLLTQLLSGVTTVRSLGDPGYEVVEAGREIAAGRLPGPRVLASGPLIAVTGGHGAPQIALVADTPEQARAQVRRSLARGVSAVKIAATGGVTDARAVGEAGRMQMSEEQMRVVCEEAHRAGVPVAAHAQGREGVLAALRAGVDTIEHGSSMSAEIVDLFRENPRALRGRSALVPTLTAALPLVHLDPAVTGADPVVRENARRILDEMLQGVQDAVAHGIELGVGTDSALTYVTHANLWRELDALVRYAGLEPAHALHAATRTNAAVLGLGDVTGAVEPGLAADLVVTAGDPLQGFRALVDPRMVVVRGRVIDRPAVPHLAAVDARLDTL